MYSTIPFIIDKINFCIFIKLQLNWLHLQLAGHKLLLFDENQIKCCSHGRMKTKIVIT